MANEKRLIDANALPIKFDGHTVSVWKCDLDAAPTVDAVEVVRCKNCGYWKHIEEGYGDCSHPRFHLDGHPDPTMEMNGFCSCGERREGE